VNGSAPLDTRFGIETPEGVVLELRPAGIVPRFAAFCIDLAIRAGLYLMLALMMGSFGQMGVAVMLITLFLVEWFYPVMFEVLNDGVTPGKSAMDLAVVDDDGLPVCLAASMIRNLLRTVDFLPLLYGAGLVSMLLTKDFKRLGDLAAGTRVVYTDPPPRRTPPPEVEPQVPDPMPPLEIQQAVIELAGRAPELTSGRLRELAMLANKAMALPDAEDPERRLLAHAAWFLGRRSAAAVDERP
jgi:uncharacterized RDD family membrane protein YckC